MKTLHFSITIHAPRKLVWETMLAPDTYREWTSAFTEGSYYDGSWEKGARIRFLDPNGRGMSSMINDNRLHEYISIKHLGFVDKGVEDTTSDSVKGWAGALENYHLSDASLGTDLKIDLDVTPEFEDDMARLWPPALAKLKAICEGQT